MIELMPLYCTLIAFSATAGIVAVKLARKLRAEATATPQTRRPAV